MTKDLTRGTPWKLIVQFALPIMAGNLLQQLYNTADTIIVGNFNGQQALSAVGACASLTVLFTALAIGFSIGAGVLISQYFGASREQELRQYAATAIVLMLAMGLLMSIIGVCSARFLLARALGTPEALLPLTLLYFRIYAAGLVFQFGYNIAAALLRALGDSKATLYFLLVSSVLNVVLDLAFVAGLGMGVAGAAIATVLSQIASCVIGFAYMHRRYTLLRFSLRELRMDLKTAGRILQVGAPMAIQQSIVSCGFLFLQRLVNYYGESMIASYTVASRMENILMIPIIGIQNTMATFAGQNMGAQRPDRVSKGLGQGVLVSLGMTLILCLAQIAGIPLIIRAFQLDAGAADICAKVSCSAPPSPSPFSRSISPPTACARAWARASTPRSTRCWRWGCAWCSHTRCTKRACSAIRRSGGARPCRGRSRSSSATCISSAASGRTNP